MHQDDLRRIQRVRVCCRVDVCDRFGIWTAVTEDICSRGCRLITSKSPREGSLLHLRLSSDLIPETLEIDASVAWVSDQHVGLNFVVLDAGPRALSASEWVERVVEHGKVFGPEPLGSVGPRVAPALRRSSAARVGVRPALTVPGESGDAGEALALPFQHG